MTTTETKPKKTPKIKVQTEDRIFYVDPDTLKIARSRTVADPSKPGGPKIENPRFMGDPFDTKHPSYKPSADDQTHDSFVQAMDEFGWPKGSLVKIRPEGPDNVGVVWDGRQRVATASAVNALRRKRNQDPILVPVIVDDGSDAVLYLDSVLLNRHRRVMDPMEEAREIQQALTLSEAEGKKLSHKELAVAYGWGSADTIKNKLKLLKVIPAAQQALSEGKISESDILKNVAKHADPEAQAKALAKVPRKSAPGKRRIAKSSTGTKSVEKRRPTVHRMVMLLDEDLKGPAKAALELALGLKKIRQVAEIIGLPKESEAYKAFRAAEKKVEE